ncbi:hypothetical protein D3C72_852080 [compost metagenome]
MSPAKGELAWQLAIDAQRIDARHHVERSQRSALLIHEGDVRIGRTIVIEPALYLPEHVGAVIALCAAEERGGLFGLPGAAGQLDVFDGVDFAGPLPSCVRQQAVFRARAIKAQRFAALFEQVDDRRGVQHEIPDRHHALKLRVRRIQIDVKFAIAAAPFAQPVDVEKEKFLRQREEFGEKPVSVKTVGRIGQHGLIARITGWPEIAGGQENGFLVLGVTRKRHAHAMVGQKLVKRRGLLPGGGQENLKFRQAHFRESAAARRRAAE